MFDFQARFFPGPTDSKRHEYGPIDEYVGDKLEKFGQLSPSCDQHNHLPPIINPYILPNAAIFLSYFNIGFAYCYLVTPVAYYLIAYQDVNASDYRLYVTILAVPWMFKIVFALLLDRISILGYRRKPWLILAWGLYTYSDFYLSTFESPSLTLVTIMMAAMSASYMFAEYCTDGLCVTRMQYERSEIKGTFQTSGFVMRTYGYFIGAGLGAILYNDPRWGWGLTISQIFALSALVPLTTVVPLLYNMIHQCQG